MLLFLLSFIIQPWQILSLTLTVNRAINTIDIDTKVDVGAYIHIPFCRRRCFYCDFPIEVVGERKSTINSEGESYINYLMKDIHTTMPILLNNPLSTLRKSSFGSIYFGGGTPSLMPPSLIDRVLKALSQYIPIADDCEITMETDPGKLHAIIV